VHERATRWTDQDFTTVAQWTMKSDPLGYRRTMKLLKDAVWFAPGWTLRDIRAFVEGMKFTLKQILPEFPACPSTVGRAQSVTFSVAIRRHVATYTRMQS
jgi:hypothetical protein